MIYKFIFVIQVFTVLRIVWNHWTADFYPIRNKNIFQSLGFFSRIMISVAVSLPSKDLPVVYSTERGKKLEARSLCLPRTYRKKGTANIVSGINFSGEDLSWNVCFCKNYISSSTLTALLLLEVLYHTCCN